MAPVLASLGSLSNWTQQAGGQAPPAWLCLSLIWCFYYRLLGSVAIFGPPSNWAARLWCLTWRWYSITFTVFCWIEQVTKPSANPRGKQTPPLRGREGLHVSSRWVHAWDTSSWYELQNRRSELKGALLVRSMLDFLLKVRSAFQKPFGAIKGPILQLFLH